VIFDRDGTIFDTFHAYQCFYEDLKAGLSEKGIEASSFEEFMEKHTNDRKRFWSRISKGRFTKRSFRVWQGTYHYRMKNRSFMYAKVFPEVKNTLVALSSNNIDMALTSGWFGTEATKIALKRHDLDGFFKVILTLDDFIEQKYKLPLPYDAAKLPFRRSITKKKWLATEALRLLDAKPEEAVFVGDAPEEIKAGKSLGIKTVAVLTGWGKEYNEKFNEIKPDDIIESLEKLPAAVREF